MEEIKFKAVGFVKNDFDETADYNIIKKQISIIEIKAEYQEALLSIKERDYIDIFFNFHKSENDKLSGKTHSGKVRGVFASRSPKRPNLIGHTSVKLLEVDGNILKVTGLDAINGSPVLDIKSTDTSLFASEKENNETYISQLKSNPRIEIWNNIKSENYDALLLKIAELHGHFCPGLAMGILGAVHALKVLGINQQQENQISVIAESRNCLTDGIQYVTSCTASKKNLIIEDGETTAFTLLHNDGRKVRLIAKDDSKRLFRKKFTEFYQLKEEIENSDKPSDNQISRLEKLKIERAFGTFEFKAEDLFDVLIS